MDHRSHGIRQFGWHCWGTAAAKNANSVSAYIDSPWSSNRPPPVATTRVPLGGTDIYQLHMAPGGVRVLTGETVYIAVRAEFSATGYYYPVPDATGVTWSEDEFSRDWSKDIGGITYYRWGYKPYSSANTTSF